MNSPVMTMHSTYKVLIPTSIWENILNFFLPLTTCWLQSDKFSR